jgi:hypothetical protein
LVLSPRLHKGMPLRLGPLTLRGLPRLSSPKLLYLNAHLPYATTIQQIVHMTMLMPTLPLRIRPRPLVSLIAQMPQQ